MTTTQTPIHLAVVIASVREGRFGPTVARWFAAQAHQRDDMVVDLVDLADAGLSDAFGDAAKRSSTNDTGDAAKRSSTNDTGDAAQRSPSIDLADRIDHADAVVVVTPEYNHSFPGPLKTAIDATGAAWRSKPVAFVAYGGLSGGLRAVEQLRPVFAELHAVTLRDTVSFHGARDRFDEHGKAHDTAARDAAIVVLDSLAWWTSVLGPARVEAGVG